MNEGALILDRRDLLQLGAFWDKIVGGAGGLETGRGHP